MARAAGSSSCAPDSATITGSITTGVASGSSASARATASIVTRSPSIPILTASTPMSLATARTWATMISGGIAWIAVTPSVFWAVIAVIAVIPCAPHAANAFRSAWMPAPPPESEPAIESTRGMDTTTRVLRGPSTLGISPVLRDGYLPDHPITALP